MNLAENMSTGWFKYSRSSLNPRGMRFLLGWKAFTHFSEKMNALLMYARLKLTITDGECTNIAYPKEVIYNKLICTSKCPRSSTDDEYTMVNIELVFSIEYLIIF